MTNSCLVTKLKGVVNNNNLPIYDTIRVALRSNLDQVSLENRYVYVTWHGDIEGEKKLRNIGGNFLDAQGNVIGTEITLSQMSGNKAYLSTDSKEIIIFGQKALRSIEDSVYNILALDISVLKYCTALYYLVLTGRNKTGDVKDLPASSRWVGLTITYCSLTGDVGTLPKILPASIIFSNNATNLTGDFADLAVDHPAGTLTVRTEGVGLQNVKVNGNLLSSYGSSPYTLTFDGAGHVTCTGT
jgi:hypothetical protein